jgi:threonine/homoserine/homoserine lactone efflux protein
VLSLISQGVSLGFTAGASPGPLQSYLISTTLAQGWRRGLLVVLTPMLTDAPIIVLAVMVLKELPTGAIRIIQVAGGMYLLWIAYGTLKQLHKSVGFTSVAVSQRRTIGQALLINWLSPAPYIFWGTITGPLLISAMTLSIWHGIAFLVAFYGAFLGFLVLLVIVFNRVRRLGARIVQGITLVTLAILTIFGLSLIAQGLGLLK